MHNRNQLKQSFGQSLNTKWLSLEVYANYALQLLMLIEANECNNLLTIKHKIFSKIMQLITAYWVSEAL